MSSSALNMIEGSSPFSRSQSPSSHCSFNRSDSQASYFSQSQSGSCDASDGGSSESGASDAAAGMAAVKTGGTASVKERDNLGKEKDSQSVFLTQVSFAYRILMTWIFLKLYLHVYMASMYICVYLQMSFINTLYKIDAHWVKQLA